MTPARWRAAAIFALPILVALAALTGCGEGADRQPAPDPSTLMVPDPDLGEMEPALRSWLTEVRTRVAERARQPGAAPSEAGEDFGQLGQLYQTFSFLDAAEICYDNARQLLPEEFRWTYLLAIVHIEKGDFEAAEQGLQRALELEPDSLAAHIRLGDVRLSLNRPQDARGEYEQALELDPESAAALFGLGRVEAAQDHPQAAADLFEKALQLQPQASVIRYPLALTYRKLGRLEEAQSQLERRGEKQVWFPDPPIDELSDVKTLTAFQVVQSLAATPEDVPPEQLLGFALTHLGKVKGTVEPLEQVIAGRAGADPLELARLHYVAGGLLVNQGQDEPAVGHFRAAVELDPSFLDAQVKLGNALARTGHLAEAEQCFARALELEPGNRDIRLKRITALLNQGRSAEAIERLRRVLEEDPGDTTASIRLAEALEAAGRRDAAATEYRKSIEAGLPAGDLARIHRAYGSFFQRQGRLEAAVDQYEKALEFDQNLVGARRDLAPLLGHLGRFRDAASQYAQVAAAQPQDERAWVGEAVALILDGNLEAAVERLGEAVAALPESPSLRHLLARLLAAAPEDSLRDGERALELARAVCDIRPTPACTETAAMAYAEMGRWNEALEWQRRAVSQLSGRPAATAARGRLSLYENRKPFRISSAEDLLGGIVGG